MTKNLPFLWGSQYYRAPTPERECWQTDLENMKKLGMNSVKFWVQWRWSHRENDNFYFDDLDELMDLAAKYGLQVTLNLIFDVVPHWLFEKYPDAKMVDASGKTIEPYMVACRQLGGMPGPCYNHPEALAERQKFLKAAVDHFKEHPALAMWDVWNEPELAIHQRTQQADRLFHDLLCYCDNCKKQFTNWLKKKYGELEELNAVWGRCYEKWQHVEMPLSRHGVIDFIDWREFFLDTLESEANWRLDLTREIDPKHVTYLHVVANDLRIFNPITGVDDFRVAKKCDVFGGSMISFAQIIQVISAAKGKVCYNAEDHMNGGGLGIHQRRLGMGDLLEDFLPQLGLGIRGFLFWQYRSEVLGTESPAWGLVNLDGSPRQITHAAKEFCDKLSPYFDRLMQSETAPPQVAIWRSRRNELFQYCADSTHTFLHKSLEAYTDGLYDLNYNFKYINETDLEQNQLDDIAFLIMPACYCLSHKEAEALNKWVSRGGILFCEAHLGGYNADKGRHSRKLPGMGLDEMWDIREIETMPSYMFTEQIMKDKELVEAYPSIRDSFLKVGFKRMQYLPIRLKDNTVIWGADRCAIVEGSNLTVEGSLYGQPCLVSKNIGSGKVYYNGTNLGFGSSFDRAVLNDFLDDKLKTVKICKNMEINASGSAVGLHTDVIYDVETKSPKFVMMSNKTGNSLEFTANFEGNWEGIFTGKRFDFDRDKPLAVGAGFIDILAKSMNE